MENQPYLIVILGPTAVGKTALSLEVADQLNTEILSADSRQIYKEMNIGTDTPSKKQRQQIPHHFINERSVTEDFNAGKFEKQALQRLEEIYQHKTGAVLVGGAGFYIKALLEGLNEMPEVPDEVRERWNQAFEEKGLEYLQEQVRKKDPDYYEEVDLNNHRRLIRALEVIETTGRTYTYYRQQNNKKKPRPFMPIKVGLHRPREELYQRINQRVDQMLDQGLLEEVKQLRNYKDYSPLKTVGYRELFQYLEGEIDYEEAVRLIKRNSRRFAKRQLTWFRNDDTIQWFQPEERTAIFQYISDQMGVEH